MPLLNRRSKEAKGKARIGIGRGIFPFDRGDRGGSNGGLREANGPAVAEIPAVEVRSRGGAENTGGCPSVQGGCPVA